MMTVDTSVWIDFLNNRQTLHTQALVKQLSDSTKDLVVLDVVLFEVLRGVRSDTEYLETYHALLPLAVETAGGKDVAIAAAQMYRYLRKKGITIRANMDVLIAAWCLSNDCELLHSDRDFDGIASQYPLRIWSKE